MPSGFWVHINFMGGRGRLFQRFGALLFRGSLILSTACTFGLKILEVFHFGGRGLSSWTYWSLFVVASSRRAWNFFLFKIVLSFLVRILQFINVKQSSKTFSRWNLTSGGCLMKCFNFLAGITVIAYIKHSTTQFSQALPTHRSTRLLYVLNLRLKWLHDRLVIVTYPLQVKN